MSKPNESEAGSTSLRTAPTSVDFSAAYSQLTDVPAEATEGSVGGHSRSASEVVSPEAVENQNLARPVENGCAICGGHFDLSLGSARHCVTCHYNHDRARGMSPGEAATRARALHSPGLDAALDAARVVRAPLLGAPKQAGYAVDASPAAEVERSLNRAASKKRTRENVVQAVVLFLSEARTLAVERLRPAFSGDAELEWRCQTIIGELADLEAAVGLLIAPALERGDVPCTTGAEARAQLETAMKALENSMGAFRRVANARDTMVNAAACASDLIEEGDSSAARKLLDRALCEVSQ